MLRSRSDLVASLKHLDTSVARAEQQLGTCPESARGRLSDGNFTLHRIGGNGVDGGLALQSCDSGVGALGIQAGCLRDRERSRGCDFKRGNFVDGDPVRGDRALLAALG